LQISSALLKSLRGSGRGSDHEVLSFSVGYVTEALDTLFNVLR
jgi:hypothetical protein